MTDAASLTQIAAADPARSTWLTANAGSGKTRVLTDRVARLLLAGVAPVRILCLTYTKAAAAEMQNRLFATLGNWAMLDDDQLSAALTKLGAIGTAPDTQELAAARRLFARAIETPGGLKIQTIHAFCAALLRRFPLEAGVSPGFTEADDRAAELLRAEIVEDMANHIAPGVVAGLAAHHTGGDLAELCAEIARQPVPFETSLTRDDVLVALGQPAGLALADVVHNTFDGAEAAMIRDVIEALRKSNAKSDLTAAQTLAALLPGLQCAGLHEIKALEKLFLFGAGAKAPFAAKVDTFPTKACRMALGPLGPPLAALMQRVEDARSARMALGTADRTAALHAFARVFLHHYEARKAAHGWLDFDDLIRGAQRLLSTSPMAQWVLYRLDGGIDHILVDEAQDTAPGQWQVIDRLAQEMTAGQGARGTARTLFVVGDKKQSIYSFQGADLAAFDAMQAHFRSRLATAPTPLSEMTLRHSFRSAPAILQAVDATFGQIGARGTGGGVAHLAYFDTLPGRVDLWPALPPTEKQEPSHWADPVDRPSARNPALVLADQIAQTIAELINTHAQIPTTDGPRAVHAGDFLVLVQRRGPLFHAIIRACKARGIDVAGADRLRLGAEIAVRDLGALLSFLATPDDDLSLAVALRSPLFGWDEAAVYRLVQPREGTVWAALEATAQDIENVQAAHTAAILHDLRDQADFLRPYEVLERALTRHGMRTRLIARLGPEAEDGIDQLLAQALAYERVSIPDLTGFLGWLEGDEAEVHRQPDAAGRKLRVMTVHGAKGLQAPIVILPDTADPNARDRAEIITLPNEGPAVWKPSADDQPEAVRTAIEARSTRSAEERLRLLYVAMTRAEVWLIIAAAGKVSSDDAWHTLAGQGLENAGAGVHDFPTGPGLRLATGIWPEIAAGDVAPSVALGKHTAPAALPVWIDQRPPPPDHDSVQWIRPSQLGGAKVIDQAIDPADPQATQAALDYGTQMHRLLEVLPALPQSGWPDRVAALVPDPHTHSELLETVRRLCAAPKIAALLAPLPPARCLIEVGLTAPWEGGQIIGLVDRLIITPDKIIAVDFKTNRDVPRAIDTVPEGLLRQMGAYRAALLAIWPDRQVETALIWTATAQLMMLPSAMVDAALTRSGLDANRAGS